MLSLTDASDQPPRPSFRWKPEWTDLMVKLLVGGIVAGASASLGFWSTWQTLRGDVAAIKADVVNIRTLDAAQSSALDKLNERQAEDDQLHAAAGEASKAILRSLGELREDFRDMRRDLTGRTGR